MLKLHHLITPSPFAQSQIKLHTVTADVTDLLIFKHDKLKMI